MKTRNERIDDKLYDILTLFKEDIISKYDAINAINELFDEEFFT